MELHRAIITGATGAIGTALTSLLVDKGIEVLVLTRPDSKRNHRIIKSPEVRVLECDFSRLDEVENLTGKDWDCFFHLAWAGASGAGRNDMLLQNDNVRVALKAVDLARRFGCKKFVGAGSQAEYGRHDERLKPDTPAFPEMGYGYAKLCAGLMTSDRAHQLGLEHNWLRVLSVFGQNDGENSLMAQTIDSLMKGVSPEFTAGEQIWDYVYNRDAAKAFFCVAEKGIDGKTYVLGSEEERPLSDYLKTLRDIIAPEVELKLGARAYSDKQVMYLAGDISDLKADTGYRADYSFEDGVREMLRLRAGRGTM